MEEAAFLEDLQILSKDEEQQNCCPAPAPPNLPHGSHPPLLSRGHFFGWFNPNVGIPLSGWQDDDFIQELVDASDQVFSVPGFVGNITEELEGEEVSAREHTRVPRRYGIFKLIRLGDGMEMAFFSPSALSKGVPGTGCIWDLLTSSTMRVAMALPISL